MQFTRHKNGGFTREFDNITEFLSHVEPVSDTIPLDKLGRTLASRETTGEYGRHSWDLGAGFDGAIELARDGWAEGKEMMEEIAAQFTASTASASVRQDVTYDVTGEWCDAGRLISGEPECMGQMHDTDLAGHGSKVVRVLVNLSASCGISAQQMCKRGAAALALVDCLEQAGRSVEVVVTCPSRGDYVGEWIIPVKRAGEMLDLDRAAFVLAHPAFFRRFLFSALEHESKEDREAIGLWNYGMPCNSSEADKTADVVVPHMLWDGDSKETLRWVFAELRKQGVEVDGGDLDAVEAHD